jgi:LysM repeat protein
MGHQHENKKQESGPDLSHSLIQPKVQSKIVPAIQSKLKSGILQSIQKKRAEQESSTKLPDNVQAKMENSFGEDFSDVNIHDNSTKAEDLGAKAFAQGKDVHFAPGEFQPNSKQGQELIGHELTHVVQQKEGKVQGGDVHGKDMVNQDVSLEKEADDAGKLASEGLSVEVNGLGSGVQMKDDKEEKQEVDTTEAKDVSFQEPSAYYIHVVKAGESLWKIAHNANSDKIAKLGLDFFNKQYLPFRVEEIRILNKLLTDELKIGQKIKLPARSIPANKEIDNWSLEKFAPLNTINTAIVSTKTYYDEIKALGFNILGIREYKDTNEYKNAGDFGPRFLVSGGRSAWGMLLANITDKRYRALIEPFLEAAVSFSTFTNPEPRKDHQEWSEAPMKVSVARAPNLPEIMEFMRAMYNVGEKKDERVNKNTKIGEGLFEETPIFRQFIAIYQPLIVSAISLDKDQTFIQNDQISPVAKISKESRSVMLQSAVAGIYQSIFRWNGNEKADDETQADWSLPLVFRTTRNSGRMMSMILGVEQGIADDNRQVAEFLFDTFVPFIKGADKAPTVVAAVKNEYLKAIQSILNIDVGKGESFNTKRNKIKDAVSDSLNDLIQTEYFRVPNKIWGNNEKSIQMVESLISAFEIAIESEYN